MNRNVYCLWGYGGLHVCPIARRMGWNYRQNQIKAPSVLMNTILVVYKRTKRVLCQYSLDGCKRQCNVNVPWFADCTGFNASKQKVVWLDTRVDRIYKLMLIDNAHQLAQCGCRRSIYKWLWLTDWLMVTAAHWWLDDIDNNQRGLLNHIVQIDIAHRDCWSMKCVLT